MRDEYKRLKLGRRIGTRVEPELRAWLGRSAARQKITISDVVRQVLRQRYEEAGAKA